MIRNYILLLLILQANAGFVTFAVCAGVCYCAFGICLKEAKTPIMEKPCDEFFISCYAICTTGALATNPVMFLFLSYLFAFFVYQC